MYSIVVKKSAFKELAQISSPYNRRIVEAIENLKNNPRPQGVKKLKADEAYRIRVGEEATVLFQKIGLLKKSDIKNEDPDDKAYRKYLWSPQ